MISNNRWRLGIAPSLLLSLVSIVSVLVLRCSALAGDIRVLIIANDDQIGVLSNGLAQYPDFGAIRVMHWSDTPDAVSLTGYDAVVVTIRWIPQPNLTAWGNIIADFARDGGGVICGFGYYNTDGPATDYGNLALPVNNPFNRGPRFQNTGYLGAVLIPGHLLMDGVDDLTTDYHYDVAANSNTVVVANFTDGSPLAGYLDVGAGRVVGIQAHYELDPVLLNRGDFMQLYRNAIVTSVARTAPAMLRISLEGINARLYWQGRGGAHYIVQSATNIAPGNLFQDISPTIELPGPGIVNTNYLDVGALTNHPARFYRVRSD